MSECDHESSIIRRPWPTAGLLRSGKKKSRKGSVFMLLLRDQLTSVRKLFRVVSTGCSTFTASAALHSGLTNVCPYIRTN